MTVEDVAEVISTVCKVVILFCVAIFMVSFTIAFLAMIFK